MSLKKLIKLAQSLEQKYQLGYEPLTTTDKYENAPNDDGYVENKIKLVEIDKNTSR